MNFLCFYCIKFVIIIIYYYDYNFLYYYLIIIIILIVIFSSVFDFASELYVTHLVCIQP